MRPGILEVYTHVRDKDIDQAVEKFIVNYRYSVVVCVLLAGAIMLLIFLRQRHRRRMQSPLRLANKKEGAVSTPDDSERGRYDWTPSKTESATPPPSSSSPTIGWEYFTFRKMVTPVLLKILWALGAIGLTVAGLLLLGESRDDTKLAGVFLLFGGNLIWRIFCEVWILFFSMHDRLAGIEREVHHARIERDLVERGKTDRTMESP